MRPYNGCRWYSVTVLHGFQVFMVDVGWTLGVPDVDIAFRFAACSRASTNQSGKGCNREILPWVLWCIYLWLCMYGFSSLAFMVLWMVVNSMAVGYVYETERMLDAGDPSILGWWNIWECYGGCTTVCSLLVVLPPPLELGPQYSTCTLPPPPSLPLSPKWRRSGLVFVSGVTAEI